MSLFNNYESELKQTFKIIRDKIPEWKASGKKKAIADSIQAELEIAQDTIDTMNLIVQSTHNGDSLRQKVKTHESTLESISDEWQRCRLLEDPDREKMSTGMVTLHKTSERLTEIERIGLESEEIGTNTVGRLKGDNVKLTKSYEEMMEIGSNVTLSRSILGRMTRRAIYSKLILTIIIVVQILAMATIIFVKWLRPLFTSPSAAPTSAPTVAPTVSPTHAPTSPTAVAPV